MSGDGLWIRESFVEVSDDRDEDGDRKRYGLGEGEVYQTYLTTLGDLYRAMQAEYGRCTGRVYIDRKGGGSVPVGWVFVKRERYEGTPRAGEPRSYLREVWVSVHSAPDTVTRTAHYYGVED
jgi:hypothetical protein